MPDPTSTDHVGRFQAARRAAVAPFYVMELLAQAAARQATHGDVLNLVAGQPSTPAPAAVRRRAKQAIDNLGLGYTVATGIPELREAISEHHRRWHGLEISRDDVVITTGASGGFLLAFLAVFEAGDRVALARPGYPCYRNVLTALGCEVVEITTSAATRFQPTVAQLDEAGPLDGLVVASPANPTGTMLLPEELAALGAWCQARGVQLISDEIYHGISFDPLLRQASAWETAPDAVVFNSFSKYFSMTGWRIGWMLTPPHLRRAVDTLAGNFTICPPTISQYAALGAFTEDSYAECSVNVERYAANRHVLLAGLEDLGWTTRAPADGAFYVYAEVSQLTDDSMQWSQEVLARTGVALTPGIDFDRVDGKHWVRLSYAGERADLLSALDRLSIFSK